MLHADKEALRTAYKLRLLAIREKELNFYTQNCLAVCTQAALLAGFACSISLGGLKALQLTSDDAQYSEGVQYSEGDD